MRQVECGTWALKVDQYVALLFSFLPGFQPVVHCDSLVDVSCSDGISQRMWCQSCMWSFSHCLKLHTRDVAFQHRTYHSSLSKPRTLLATKTHHGSSTCTPCTHAHASPLPTPTAFLPQITGDGCAYTSTRTQTYRNTFKYTNKHSNKYTHTHTYTYNTNTRGQTDGHTLVTQPHATRTNS